MDLKSFCLDQLDRYPALETQDMVKALYQREFGCGHMITDRARGLKWLRDELASCRNQPSPDMPPLTEPLGMFCRVHLRAADHAGLSADTLFRLFELSAQAPCGDMQAFRAQLAELESLIRAGQLPLPNQDAAAFLAPYMAAGCPATHHSPAFSMAYAPAYRVIRAEYARFLPLFARIDQLLKKQEHVILAIEGGSASGKTTLAALLEQVYGCGVFHMDDFFLQMHQRTPERFKEPGGNVDYERFLAEVLMPLSAGKPFSYRPFLCSSMSLGEPVSVTPKQLSIVEGAYSMHPALAGYYDASAFLSIDPEKQAARILKRNGPDMQKRFLEEWIPLEHLYFDACGTRARCSMVIETE